MDKIDIKLDSKTVVSRAEMFKFALETAQNVFNVEKLNELTPSQFGAVLRLINERFFRGYDIIYINGAHQSLLNAYILLCDIADKVPCYMDYLILCDRLDMLGAYGEKLRRIQDEIRKHISAYREERIKGKLLQNKSPVGSIAVANIEYGWQNFGNTAKIENRTLSLDDLGELPRLNG